MDDHQELLCQVLGCDEPGTEAHHWVPREVFGAESEKWPRAVLCKTHHDEWHRRMVGYRVDTTSDLKTAIAESATAKRMDRPAGTCCVILKDCASANCRSCGVRMDHDVHSTDEGFWCAKHCPAERHK